MAAGVDPTVRPHTEQDVAALTAFHAQETHGFLGRFVVAEHRHERAVDLKERLILGRHSHEQRIESLVLLGRETVIVLKTPGTAGRFEAQKQDFAQAQLVRVSGHPIEMVEVGPGGDAIDADFYTGVNQ